MEVRIREVNPVIVKTIDELARKNNQSRQVYLKKQIELLATDYMQSEKISHLEKQLQANTLTLKEVAKAINRMNSIIEELMEDGE